MIDPVNVRTKFEVCSFTHSWDNKGYSKNLGSPWICPRSLFSQIFYGHLFGWTLWTYLPNLKFVAVPVPEIIWDTKKFGQSLDMPTLLFLPNFSRAFDRMDPLNGSATFAVNSFTRSWDSSDCSFGLGLWTPNLGEGEDIRGRDGTIQKSVGDSYRPSVVTFHPTLRVSEILLLLCSSTPLPHPTSSLPKISPCSPGITGWPLSYEEWRCWANCRSTSFQDFQHMWSWSTNVTKRQTDRWTDRQTCNLNTALCTIVHCTVKTAQL